MPVRRRGDRHRRGAEDDDENLDLEEELHPDDVEEPLDVLLPERTTAERLDEDEDDLEDDDEPDDPARAAARSCPAATTSSSAGPASS